VVVTGTLNVFKVYVWVAPVDFPLQKKHSYYKVDVSVLNTVGKANLKQSTESSTTDPILAPNK